MNSGFYHAELGDFYSDIKKLCRKDAYNLVLHKHLGDVFYAIGLKKEFEKLYKSKLHFIVRPQHEFLMKIYGIRDYSVYDLDSCVRKNFNLVDWYFKGVKPTSNQLNGLDDLFFQAMFPGVPVAKGEPFVCDNLINGFLEYDKYWCFRWAKNIGMDDDFKFLIPKNNITLSETAKKALKKIAPIEKIVLFAPEAATALEFAPEFWNIIAEQVHKKGYTIIVNSKKYKINHGISAFDLGLSLQDVVALGLNCAYVFSLRSGLCDVLVGAGERLYAFYPAQLRREYKSLEVPFCEKTNVNEILIYNWKISSLMWENIDLTKTLQKYINSLHISYYKEAIKRFFAKKSNKRIHRFWQHLFNDIAGISKVFPENNIQNPKPKLKNNIRFLGLTIYKNFTIDSQPVKNRKIYLGGLIHHTKYLNDGARFTRVLSLPIYQRRYGKYEIVKILGIPVYIKNRTKDFMKQFDSYLNNDYDDYYLIRHNIGETYIYLSHIKDWIKHNDSKKPVVIVWREKDMQYYKLFVDGFADLLFIPLKQDDLNKFFQKDITYYKGHRFICNTYKIAENMYKINKLVKKNNFYNFITKDFSDCLTDMNVPKIDNQKKRFIKEYIKTKVDGKQFILVCPNATSLRDVSVNFWETLIYKLNKLGYVIICNGFENEIKMKGVINISMDIVDMMAIASLSKGMISLASGLSVLLSSVSPKSDLIYTDFKNGILNSTLGLKLYSVKNIPVIKNKKVREYDIKDYTEEELISSIIKGYK